MKLTTLLQYISTACVFICPSFCFYLYFCNRKQKATRQALVLAALLSLPQFISAIVLVIINAFRDHIRSDARLPLIILCGFATLPLIVEYTSLNYILFGANSGKPIFTGVGAVVFLLRIVLFGLSVAKAGHAPLLGSSHVWFTLEVGLVSLEEIFVACVYLILLRSRIRNESGFIYKHGSYRQELLNSFTIERDNPVRRLTIIVLINTVTVLPILACAVLVATYKDYDIPFATFQIACIGWRRPWQIMARTPSTTPTRPLSSHPSYYERSDNSQTALTSPLRPSHSFSKDSIY